jgi:hypothetical protein
VNIFLPKAGKLRLVVSRALTVETAGYIPGTLRGEIDLNFSVAGNNLSSELGGRVIVDEGEGRVKT